MKTLIKWTIEEYHRLIETGILSNRQVELLAGEIIEMSPEGPLHYSIAESSADYLKTLLAKKAHIRFNGPITLEKSEPVPDIAIVKLPQESYRNHHPSSQEIFWLIEISKSTLNYDLEEKQKVYAKAGIEEYWVIDVINSQIYILRHPNQEAYQSISALKTGNIAPLSFPNLEISVTRFFN